MNELTKQNDLYIYFEVIRQLRADPVLDLGMTLKRAGAVSRQIADSAIPPDTTLVGVDFASTPSLPVYETLYDRILTMEKLLSDTEEFPHFALAVSLFLPELSSHARKLLPFLKANCSFILTDSDSHDLFLPYFSEKKARSIKNGQNEYLLIETN